MSNLWGEIERFVVTLGGLTEQVDKILKIVRQLPRDQNPTDEWTNNFHNLIKGELAMLSDAITAKLTEINTAIATEKEEVKAALDALSAQIADLKTQVAAGVSPEEVVAALDGLETSVKAIYEVPPVA
jgi:hypothetical protein